MISYDEFSRVDVRSGTIIRVESFPEARKPAYKIWVDFGSEIGELQTSAQVTVLHKKDDLIGRQIAGVVNLGPKRIAGFKSEFLLLGFSNQDGVVSLITTDPVVPNGKKMF